MCSFSGWAILKKLATEKQQPVSVTHDMQSWLTLRHLKSVTFSFAFCSCLCKDITSCLRVSFSCCITRKSDFSRDIWRLVFCSVSSRPWTCNEQESSLALAGPTFLVSLVCLDAYAPHITHLGSLMEGEKKRNEVTMLTTLFKNAKWFWLSVPNQ